MFNDKTYFKISFSIVAIFLLACLFILPKSFSGEWYFSPILLTAGPLAIRWYGLLIASAVLIGYFISRLQQKKETVSDDDIMDSLILGIIFGVLGARIYYVAFNFDYFKNDLISAFKIWEGGLAIHGALFGALLSTFLYSRLKKNCSYKFLQGSDLFTHVLPFAQAMGRWGNFMNHEAYGTPTNLPWKMFIAPEHRMPGFENSVYFHPTFLYESAWDIFTFLVLFYFIRNKRKNNGEVTALYFMMYSLGRGFIEMLRTDSLMVGERKTAVMVSVILFIIGLLMFIILRKNGEKTNPGKA